MKKVLAAVYLFLALPLGAAAFHPFITEDTGFLDRDEIQAEIGFDHSEKTSGTDSFSNELAAQFSYGLWDKLEIMISAPWQGWNSGGLSESGLGDVSLETKFWVASRGGWDLALKPGFSLPAGDDAKGLGAGKGQAWVIGVAGRVDGPREYYFNAGYKNNSNSVGEERDLFSASAMAAHKVLPGLFAAAELAIETNTDKGAASHPVQTVLGLVWETTPYLDLSAGARFGLNNSADDFGLLAGVTIRF